jgi:hypothetical protein
MASSSSSCPMDDDVRVDDDNASESSLSSSSFENVANFSEAVEQAQEANNCSRSRTHYMSVPAGEAKKVLFAMCLGLRANEDPNNPTTIRYLSDFDVEPYLSLKNKKTFCPMHKHILNEIQRRFEVLKIPAADRFKRSDKIKATMNAARTWLKEHPLTNQQDILFLQSEEKKFYDIHVMARLESRAMALQKACGGAGGIVLTGKADMRLIHCILEDGVREAFLGRHDSLERDGLWMHGNATTWNQQIANLFNDPNFTAVTEVFPELHSDFAQEISINRSDCPSNLTPEQVDFWVTDRQIKLLNVQRRHQLSRNGEGSRRRDIGSEDGSNIGNIDEEEDDDGDKLEYMPDNRAVFLQTERSTILYQWEMFEKYNILDSLLSVLPSDLGVSSSMSTTIDSDDDIARSAANSTRRKRRRRQQSDDGSNNTSSPSGMAIQNAHIAAMSSMVSVLKSMAAARTNSTKAADVALARASLASARDAVEKAEKNVLFMTEKLEEAENPLVKAAYEGRLPCAQQRLESAEERYVEAEEAYKLAKEERLTVPLHVQQIPQGC